MLQLAGPGVVLLFATLTNRSVLQETQMSSYSTLSRYIGIGAALVAMAAPLAAQKRAVAASENPVLAAKIKAEAGRLAGDYWTPKLNSYKVQIDRLLSPTDLDDLNRLRVRWSILLEEQLKNVADRKVGGSKADGGATVEMKVDENDAAKMGEIMDIYTRAKGLADRYHADLTPLGETVVGDVIGFGGALAERSDRFVDEHRGELTNGERQYFTEKRKDLAELVEGLKSDEGKKGLTEIYAMAIEPMVMLYNGADLREILEQLGPVAKPVSGVEIPASSTLQQNFPNPASARTTVVFNLAEPSSRTTLRLFNAVGDLVETLDLGSRPAGEGSVELDVSKLASGSYLYHLTYQTANGEQVASKRMQVVR
jgi:hypothetical protein